MKCAVASADVASARRSESDRCETGFTLAVAIKSLIDISFIIIYLIPNGLNKNPAIRIIIREANHMNLLASIIVQRQFTFRKMEGTGWRF